VIYAVIKAVKAIPGRATIKIYRTVEYYSFIISNSPMSMPTIKERKGAKLQTCMELLTKT